jgi:2-oxoisovalerate dehydrogenase E1 component
MNVKKHENLIKNALFIRLVEEKLLELFKSGKINGTVHTCVGQELIPVCLAEYLNDDDYILSNHRGHGHLLSRNTNVEFFFAELMGRKSGICGGIGGSQHLYRKNHLSNGIQGGMTPIAAGIALANKIKNNGKVVVCYIGDGTLGQGIIYESFNIAALWNLPVIYIVENNKFAQSTSCKQTMCGSIELRAKGFGMEYLKTNIWDIDDMLTIFQSATDIARSKHKACFIEVDTYRLLSHSKGDDNRNPSEVEHFQSIDIINKEINTNPEFYSDLILDLKKQINLEVSVAEKSLLLNIVKDDKIEISKVKFSTIQNDSDVGKRINELIYLGLKDQFSTDDDTIMIGEDIEYLTPYTSIPYGGAFKVTKDLSEKFKNIYNTPISEAAITGIGTGLAIGGMKPIVEIMFGDFLTLTFDQLLNHACKFKEMYNGQLDIPLVIRTPMGGKRGYGPTHSQSIEKHFLGIQNLTIVALNHRVNPRLLYGNIFSCNNPVLVIENKVLYTNTFNIKPTLGYKIEQSDEVFPTIRISPENKKAEITILCYGETLTEVEKAIEIAFLEDEILCEIICPTQINPINISLLLTSLQNTNRLLVVEEGSNIASFSSEVSALLMENNIALKSFVRISNNGIIPSSYSAEMNILPNPQIIYQGITSCYG